MLASRVSHLRVREGHGHHRVTFVELFFDLVFVFAVTQLSHGLLHHLTPLGALQTAVLLVAVWWSWIDTAWITNWIDPERAPVRLLLFVLMFAGLVMSVSIPRAFEDRALCFALAYVFMQASRALFMLWVLRRHDANNFDNFLRIGIWHAFDMPFWIAGCFVEGPARLGLWTLAIAIETAAPALGFYVPGLGRSSTADWTVEGGHLAERCGLFVIIALGESILITGANFAELDWNATTAAAFAVNFVGSIAMWVIYFNIGAERSSRQIASSGDPGRLARSGYTYFHLPIIGGIIVSAVADERVLHHPGGHVDAAMAATIIGGSAFYLAGNVLFKRLSAPNFPLSHLVGLGSLAALVAVVPYTTPLKLAAVTAAILIIVAVWEWHSLRPGSESA